MQDENGAPVSIGVWYPTDAPARPEPLGGWMQVVATAAPAAAGRHPIVVMSHGHGGWFAGHYDTALALARAGFVVAALTHPGDNYADESRAIAVDARARDLTRLIGYMISAWPRRMAVDSSRVGVFGFSAGAFSALVASGGVPDFDTFAGHCRAHPANDDCAIVREAGPEAASLLATFKTTEWAHDGRIRAAVVAAPALGFTFVPDGLRGVTVPVQLWRAENDRVLPFPEYAEAVRQALPTPPDVHVVPGAGHYDFLAPCDSTLAARVPEICTSAPGFDRPAFHRTFNAAVVQFFQLKLR